MDEGKPIESKFLRLRRCSEEFHFNVDSQDIELHEMQEGDETPLFWEAINERTRQRKYYSLLDVSVRANAHLTATMRIFHLSSLHGPFVAQELVYLLRSPDHIAPFPFTQADLYDLPQPALCLIDASTELFVWQGWTDLSDDELDLQLYQANLQAGNPKDLRFAAERRCAFRTAVDYCKGKTKVERKRIDLCCVFVAKTGSATVDLPCSVVYAGLEPLEFINLFPKWTVHTKARQQNLSVRSSNFLSTCIIVRLLQENKQIDQKDSIPDLLKHLCREQYTLEELRTRPLPEGKWLNVSLNDKSNVSSAGVDPSKIESYLSDEDFQVKTIRDDRGESLTLPSPSSFRENFVWQKMNSTPCHIGNKPTWKNR